MFKIKAILPKIKDFLSPKRYLNAVDNEFQAIAKEIQSDLEKTVSSWARKPEFHIVKKGIYYQVVTNDSVYKFVSHGTRVRYAVMSKDFVPKTSPGIAVGGGGSGGVVFVSRKTPRPGIKARNFEKIIAADYQKTVPRRILKAIRNAKA